MQLSEKNPEILLQILHLIDLTRLNQDDDAQKIRSLCEKAEDLVAAVCVFPKFIKIAKAVTKPSCKIATVSNFPQGNQTILETINEIKTCIELGADEIDVVLPYQYYVAKERSHIQKFLDACREASNGYTLKIIIESGVLTDDLIKIACQDVINAQANFIKTSTGKVPIGATLEAATIILKTIVEQHSSIGIKISGGIQTIEQAMDYLSLTAEIMGENWIHPQNFRFGASKLFDNVQNVINFQLKAY